MDDSARVNVAKHLFHPAAVDNDITLQPVLVHGMDVVNTNEAFEQQLGFHHVEVVLWRVFLVLFFCTFQTEKVHHNPVG